MSGQRSLRRDTLCWESGKKGEAGCRGPVLVVVNDLGGHRGRVSVWLTAPCRWHECIFGCAVVISSESYVAYCLFLYIELLYIIVVLCLFCM